MTIEAGVLKSKRTASLAAERLVRLHLSSAAIAAATASAVRVGDVGELIQVGTGVGDVNGLTLALARVCAAGVFAAVHLPQVGAGNLRFFGASRAGVEGSPVPI